MRITSLTLVGYKRFMLNNIRHFHITFTNIIQLILGTNGSGKSSLLFELTPLPANSSDYHKDGKKVITIEDHGNSYTLTSIFDPKPAHSFIKNGEELNPGGTMMVQKELVKQEFQITPDIHQLLIGQKRFTDMSPSEKRIWLTRLSDVNYDFALQVFQGLRVKHRDITGALKKAKERLVEVTAKQISPEEQTRIKDEVSRTHAELSLLLENRAPITRPVAHYETDVQQAVHLLNDLSNKLFMIKFTAPYGLDQRHVERDEWGELKHIEFRSVEEVEEAITYYQHEKTVIETLIKEVYQEYRKLEETKQTLEKTGSEGLESLKHKLHQYQERRNTLLEQRILKLEGIPPAQAIPALNSIKEVLRHVFETIPNNADNHYSRSKLTEYETKLATQREERLALEGRLNKLNANKVHLESHKQNSHLTCPKCQHKWIEGYSDELYQKVLDELAQTEETYQANQKAITLTEEQIKSIHDYSVIYRDYSNCVRNVTVLSPFWNYLISNQIITHTPLMGIALLERLEHDLHLEQQVCEIEQQCEDTKLLISSTEKLGDENLSQVIEKLNYCQLRSEIMTEQLTTVNKAIYSHKDYRLRLLDATTLANKIEQQIHHVETLKIDMVEMIRRETLQHCIRQLQSTLSQKEEVLQSMKHQEFLISDLRSQIEKLELEEEAMKLLIRELSPTDGLVAEGLMGFINVFTKKMNHLIKMIWSYPLVIKTCKPDDHGNADLDYQFPMVVGNGDGTRNTVPDVGCGSSGIKEVIDLAFRITALKYLKLTHQLVLDEFAKTFDVTHRVAASEAIKQLIDQHDFQQLFMVSHYQEGYGSLIGAEVCVLDSKNIAVPAEYNQHVIIA